MKVKKALFYAAPVALAGFLYIGEATGIGEVLAKTVTTVVKTLMKGDYIGTTVTKGTLDDKYIYEAQTAEGDIFLYKYYKKITETETQTEVPDDPRSSDVSVKVVPTVDPEAEAARESTTGGNRKGTGRGSSQGTEGSRAEDGRLCERDCENDRTGNSGFYKDR